MIRNFTTCLLSSKLKSAGGMARILLLPFQATILFHWGIKSSKDDIHVRSCRRVAPPYNLILTTSTVLKCIHAPLFSQRMPSSSVAMGHNFYYICWQKISKLILIFRKLWRRNKNLLKEKYLIHLYQKYNIIELFNDLYHCNMNLWYRFDRINSGDFFAEKKRISQITEVLSDLLRIKGSFALMVFLLSRSQF